jgi:uncharacterized damage-inducible protein DinB
MTKDTVLLFAKYNKYANGEMNTFIEQLSEEQWENEFSGYYKSIKSLCTHVYIADFNWLKRFSLIKPFTYLGNPLFENTYPWNADIFSGISDYMLKRKAFDTFIESFAEEITDEDLTKFIQFKISNGKAYNKNTGNLILHMFNHETHHRGMISQYLDMLGIHNDFSNLMAMD